MDWLKRIVTSLVPTSQANLNTYFDVETASEMEQPVAESTENQKQHLPKSYPTSSLPVTIHDIASPQK